jgi:hypothetical protein
MPCKAHAPESAARDIDARTRPLAGGVRAVFFADVYAGARSPAYDQSLVGRLWDGKASDSCEAALSGTALTGGGDFSLFIEIAKKYHGRNPEQLDTVAVAVQIDAGPEMR